VKVRVRCPGKVNLHLEVLGRRADRYHELRTLFATIGIWDELELALAPAGVLELAVEPPSGAPPGDDNLVICAARALVERFGVAQGARMRLTKTIPVGGGLGGGSSDAAGALVGLSRLWGLPGGFAALYPIAARLGADVPFFLFGGAAWGVGRGAEVYPLPDLPAWWVVLVPGPEPISTASVYEAFDRRELDALPASEVYQWVVAGGALRLSCCRNDLQPTVVAHWPEVGRRLDRLRVTEPKLALLAGSGGTVFGVYTDVEHARLAVEQLVGDLPRLAPVLGRDASRLRSLDVEETSHGNQ
jgi:4-diphosphocytidyl-2-C-methyl-D-erythritol kinase